VPISSKTFFIPEKAPQCVQQLAGAPRFSSSKIVPMKHNKNGKISETWNFIWNEKQMDGIQNKKRRENLR
jgi:hypothetical protein